MSDKGERAELLKEEAVESLRLTVELYNRPYSLGRQRGALLHLGTGFELLLKSAILRLGGGIDTGGTNEQTIGLTKCINRCHTGSHIDEVRFLEDVEKILLDKVKYDRDAAAHNLVETSEKQLYTFAEAGVTTFDEILYRVHSERLADHIPGRVLPLSTEPPENLALLIDDEYQQIQNLIEEGNEVKAKARLRAIESLERAADELTEDYSPISDSELESRLQEVENERDWTKIFRGAASLDFTTNGAGPTMKLQLTKSEGVPVRLVSEGDAEEEETVIGVKRVSERDFYNLGIQDIGQKLPISWQKAKTVAIELDILNDEEYYKEIEVGSSTYKRYSGHALKRIKEAIEKGEVNPDETWEKHGW
jgi:hypothetical protein